MPAVDVLIVMEAADRLVLVMVGGAQHEARPGQRDVAGIFALAERAPLGMPWAGEDVFDFFQIG